MHREPWLPWKEDSACAEEALVLLMEELGRQLRAEGMPCRVLLEGPMGAGKSTAARALVRAMGCATAAEGSPTFAIAHEYSQPRVIHLDLYRIESEEELSDAGIPAYFWENPDSLVLSEWTSRFPALERALLEDASVPLWKISLGLTESPGQRSVKIERAKGAKT